MLWNKRKPNEPAGVSSHESQSRVSDSDRSLDAVGNLLKTYGRFAFDTEQQAAAIREQCELWAHRIILGDSKKQAANTEGATPTLLRDWHGLQTFFDERRKEESDFVSRSLSGLRRAVFNLARSLGGNVGEARESDARVGRELDVLSRALTRRDVTEIASAANSVIQTSRQAMTRRREREARHVAELDQQLRDLRETLTEENRGATLDELTGLFNGSAYQQQLEQLTAIGLLLENAPWLVLIGLDEPVGSGERRKAHDESVLLEVSKCVSRAFLRKQDFVARSGSQELAALLVDMTDDQLTSAIERLLSYVRKQSGGLRRSKAATISIGIARLRAGEDSTSWRVRAEVALGRARQDGGDGYHLSNA